MGKGLGNIILALIVLAAVTAGAIDLRWLASFIWSVGTDTVESADAFVQGNNNRDTYPYNPLGNLGGD